MRWPVAVALLSTLVGCTAPPVRDSAPEVRPDIDFARMPDAVPRVEPHSRYGNPPSYEVFGKRYYVKAADSGFVQRGIASWYGTKFHGRRTSSGEPYDMYKMTAAHKTLPLPSYVRVTRLATGKSVVVRVNDRGPFHGNRIIDLSYAAARKLGFTDDGTAEVEIQLIDPAKGEPQLTTEAPAATPRAATLAAAEMQPAPEPVSMAPISIEPVPVRQPAASTPMEAAVFLQVGAFSDRANAEQLRTRLAEAAWPVVIEPSEATPETLYRVRVGPLLSVEEADSIAARLNEMGIASPRVIRH